MIPLFRSLHWLILPRQEAGRVPFVSWRHDTPATLLATDTVTYWSSVILVDYLLPVCCHPEESTLPQRGWHPQVATFNCSASVTDQLRVNFVIPLNQKFPKGSPGFRLQFPVTMKGKQRKINKNKQVSNDERVARRRGHWTRRDDESLNGGETKRHWTAAVRSGDQREWSGPDPSEVERQLLYDTSGQLLDFAIVSLSQILYSFNSSSFYFQFSYSGFDLFEPFHFILISFMLISRFLFKFQ